MSIISPVIFNMVVQNAESTSFLVLDRIGTIQDINIGFQKSFGYSRKSLIGKNYSVLFIEESRKNKLPEEELRNVLENGSVKEENYILHEDGSHIWVHGESIYVKDENGQEYIVKIIQDINEEKVLEQKLIKKNEEQKRIIEDDEAFIYLASHDLTSPVNNMEALLTELEENYDNPEEVKFFIPLMKDSVERLKMKIIELSDIGKEQETQKKMKSTVEFRKIFNDVLLDLENEIKGSGAEISSDFSQAPTIKFSKKNLKSILQNLLSNSIKYRFPNRPLIVDVRTKNIEGGYILLNVQDNGLGIELERKDKIFTMYHRLHTHIKGTGVGLGIVKKIIKNSGGKIELESKKGEGSNFKIYLKV